MKAVDFLTWCRHFSANASTARPLVMGILNCTPDSFSEGGLCMTLEQAQHRVDAWVKAGVDLIDVGGESTRPFAKPVSLEEELSRVMPVITWIKQHYDVAISIDTSKAAVMRAAVEAGAVMINDVSALMGAGSLETAVALDVPVCLMHHQGSPETMQINPSYPEGVVADVHTFFASRWAACQALGMRDEHVILDPGFGFGKTVEQNCRLTKALSSFKKYHRPLLYGVSRKSSIGTILNRAVSERLAGSLGLAVYSVLQGVNIIRTHDVEATQDALRIVHAVHSVRDDNEY